jgi:SAM-dependent methyltransferase
MQAFASWIKEFRSRLGLAPGASRTGRGDLPSVSLGDLAPRCCTAPRIIEEHRSVPPRRGYPHDDLGALLRILSKVRPRNVLELGTGYGNTVANICANCEARVFTVNALPEQISGSATTYVLDRDRIGSVYRAWGFAPRVTQIYANTLEMDLTRCLPGACIDLAIIGACHDTRYVINDFRKVLAVLRGRAVVLLHDTHPGGGGHLRRSYRACRHLRDQGFGIVHIRDTWWAYWRRPHWETLRRPLRYVRRKLIG